MINRKAYKYLLQWKDSEHRKPLLVRGARQVGKTTLVRHFSGNYKVYLELNLEREKYRRLFEQDNIDKILNAIYIMKGVKPGSGPTLLFIDEIQEFPKAIKLLRYFYEEKPELHIIAAGSLLEFALKEVPSFPVGRIDYLYLHPLNFEEYLDATTENQIALEALHNIPVEDYAHDTLIDFFHEYAIIGGMPEIVEQYLKNKNIASLSDQYKKLWQAYKDDAEKYAQNASERKIIKHILQKAPNVMDRVKFEGFGESSYRSREVREAMTALDLAKVVQLIYPTTNTQAPLNTNFKKSPRLQFLDTGMLNNILMLQGEMIMLKDLNDFYRGKIIQQLVTQELIAVHQNTSYKPHFWVREKKTSNAEVDLIYQYLNYLIPIEIKSGKQGRLRSLHQFIDRSNHPYAIRLYSEKFSIEKHETISGKKYLLMNMPYYLAFKIPQYISYFIKNHKL